MAPDFDIANAKIKLWGDQTLGKLKSEIGNLKIEHRANSTSPKAAANSTVVRTPKSGGLVSRVSYIFPRHMIYVHKGVGRGTKISEVGNTRRKAKPWFNPVIDQNIEELADIVASEMGAAIINNLLIK
jgi:hypothetical protein